MKRFSFAILFIILAGLFFQTGYAQYNPDMTGYIFNWRQLNLGVVPDTLNNPFEKFRLDTTDLKVKWERGDPSSIPYQTPYTTSPVVQIDTILNNPSLWIADSASYIGYTVNLTQGYYYEFTIEEYVSELGVNLSGGHSDPVYIYAIRDVVVRVVIGVGVSN